MKCLYCQGLMEQDTSPVHIDRQGYHLTFDAVPALVCSQCGEAYFDEQEVSKIQAVIDAVEVSSLPLRQRQLPVAA